MEASLDSYVYISRDVGEDGIPGRPALDEERLHRARSRHVQAAGEV
jgi:hypothetical protein